MKVQNKTVVVTGGGNGIGRELVLNLLTKGARVSAVDINQTGLRETAELAGDKKDKLSTHVLSITDKNAVEVLPQQVVAIHGAVDGIINNAGIIQPFVRIKDLDDADINRVMNVNFYGQIYMVKAFLPHLLQRPQAHIVNISSMGGFFPVPGQTVYGASKAAVKLLAEGLYAELIETSVNVTVVFPGAIATNIAQHSGVSIDLPGHDPEQQAHNFSPVTPKVAAGIIIDGVEKDRFQVYVGRDARMMNILYRLSPRWATNFMFKQMKALLPD